MRKRIVNHLKITVIFLLLLSLYRLKIDFSLIFLWLGGLVGALILDLDYLFQVFLVQPDLPLSKEAKTLWQEKKYQEILKLVYAKTDEITKYTFHTLFFQAIFFLFSFFVMTSTASHFGQALVLCASLHLLTEQIADIREKGMLSDYWFARLNVYLPKDRQKLYVGGLILVFCVLATFIAR